MSRPQKFLSKKWVIQGYTLVEALISLGIFMGGAYGGISYLSKYNKNLSQVETKINSRTIVNSLAEQVGSNVAQYEIDYKVLNEGGNNAGAFTADEVLPLAWDLQGTLVPFKECPKCKGRLGAKIVPIKGFRELFLLNLKIEHKEFENPVFVKKLLIQ